MEPEDWLDDTYDQAEESTEYSGMHGHKTELDDSEVFNPTVANRPMGGSPYRNGEGVTNTTGTTGATDTTAKDKTGVTKYPGWEYNPSTRKYYNPNDSSDYNNPNYKYEEGGDDFLENLRKRTQEEAKIEQEQLRISRDGYDFAKPNTREKQLNRFGNTYQTMDEKYLGFLSEQKENERLGIADTRAKYLADNRLENQGAGEATWNAIKRTGVGAFYKTVSGISGMFDIEDHMNQDDEIGNWLSNWADEGNIEYQNDNRIYTSDNKSFSSLNWWLKNGSDLSASMISFMLQAQVMARLGPAAPLAGLSKLLKLGKAAKYLRSAAGIANTASKTRKAVAGVEAVAGAAATAKKVSGVATAAESAALAATNAKKASTVVGLAESAAVKAGTTGTGLSGAAISRGQDILEYTQDGITAYMLNQSESIMSAAPIYKEAYDEAIRRGHGTEYAKQVAALAGSTVISTNRANFVLNMTSVGKIMKASGLRSAGVSAPATWGKTIKSVGFESGQEAVEESINYLGELSGKMAYQGVLDKGAKMDTSFATYGKSEDTTLASRLVSAAAVLSPAGALYGFYDGVTAGADILTGKLGGVGNNGRNSWNSVDWGDLAESAFLGAMGGAGQTMMTDGVVGRLGSSSGWLSKVPGLNYVNSRLFGQKKEQRWETNSTQLGDDGQPLYKKGDIKYEMEDDIATENVSYKKGELADRDINYNSPKVDANGTPIMRKVETTNADGTKLVTEVPDTDKVTIAKQGEVITDEMIASMTSQNIFKITCAL